MTQRKNIDGNRELKEEGNEDRNKILNMHLKEQTRDSGDIEHQVLNPSRAKNIKVHHRHGLITEEVLIVIQISEKNLLSLLPIPDHLITCLQAQRSLHL